MRDCWHSDLGLADLVRERLQVIERLQLVGIEGRLEELDSRDKSVRSLGRSQYLYSVYKIGNAVGRAAARIWPRQLFAPHDKGRGGYPDAGRGCERT